MGFTSRLPQYGLEVVNSKSSRCFYIAGLLEFFDVVWVAYGAYCRVIVVGFIYDSSRFHATASRAISLSAWRYAGADLQGELGSLHPTPTTFSQGKTKKGVFELVAVWESSFEMLVLTLRLPAA